MERMHTHEGVVLVASMTMDNDGLDMLAGKFVYWMGVKYVEYF